MFVPNLSFKTLTFSQIFVSNFRNLYICNMKKVVKSASLIAVVFLYFFAMSIDSFTIIDFASPTNSDKNTTGYITDQNSGFLYHPNQNVQVIFNFAESASRNLKNLNELYLAASHGTANLLECQFSQYSNADSSFPISFSKPDIVYPFHYFL